MDGLWLGCWLLLLGAAVLVACGPAAVDGAGAGVADSAAAALAPAPLEAETTPESLPDTAPSADTADQCLECHRDSEQLIDTADPEEEVISENEGMG